MKSSNQQFIIRRRQSQWAIVFIVLKHIKRLVSQLWPLLIAAFLGRNSSSSFVDRMELIGAGIGSLGMLWGIASFYRYYYSIEGQELLIERGIFRKIRLNLPFERIQSVNFDQNLLHQFLGVTAVSIESAGSDQKELQIDALDMETAEALRAILLQKNSAVTTTLDTKIAQHSNELKEEEILRLDTRDIVRVGITQNHFRPIGLLFGLAGSIWFYGYTFGFDPVEVFRRFFALVEGHYTALASMVMAFGMIIMMIAYSVVMTWLRHYDLRFWRSEKRFQVVQGLFNRRQFSAVDNKIQIISWHQNPLQKLLSFYSLHFSQARSNELEWKETDFSIPGCDLERIDKVLGVWLGRSAIDNTIAIPISRHYFWHKLRYIIGLMVLGISLTIYFSLWIPLILVIGSALFMTLVYYISFVKKKYAYDGQDIYIGGGVFGVKHSLLPVHKVQNVAMKQNPYQVRRDLASLYIYTAAGRVIIPYISMTESYRLIDDILYRVETSDQSWM